MEKRGPAMKVVERGDVALMLTRKKYEIHAHNGFVRVRPMCARVLRYLMEREGCAVPKECLYRDVWTPPRPEPKMVDIYICLLRRHLRGINLSMPHHIQTVFGIGYRFVPNIDVSPEEVSSGHRSKEPRGERNTGVFDRMYDLYFENREV